MAEMVAARTLPARASGEGWRTLDPHASLSLRVDFAAAQAPLAAAGLPLSIEACRATTAGEWTALWLGPDEQLLVGPDAAAAQAIARIATALAALPHSLVDVGHRQCSIELAGPAATQLLAMGCPLDFGSSQVPVGFSSRTAFAKAEVILWRQAPQRFQLSVWRSFLPYVTGLLAVGSEEIAAAP